MGSAAKSERLTPEDWILAAIALAGTVSAQNTDFRAVVRSGTAPLDVQFQLRYGGTATPSWDFGDGSTAAERTPLHTYTQPGTYSVVAPGTSAT